MQPGSIESQVASGVESAAPKLQEGLLAKLQAWFASPDAPKPTASLAADLAKIAELNGKVAELTKQLETANAEISVLRDNFQKLTDAAAKADTDHKAALEAKEADLEKRSKIKAREQLSRAGHTAVADETSNGADATSTSLDEIRKQMRAETDPRKRGELARQARDLRGHKDLFGSN